MPKLNKQFVDKLKPLKKDTLYRDSSVIGFGLRVKPATLWRRSRRLPSSPHLFSPSRRRCQGQAPEKAAGGTRSRFRMG
jgi:hypothetical protein